MDDSSILIRNEGSSIRCLSSAGPSGTPKFITVTERPFLDGARPLIGILSARTGEWTERFFVEL